MGPQVQNIGLVATGLVADSLAPIIILVVEVDQAAVVAAALKESTRAYGWVCPPEGLFLILELTCGVCSAVAMPQSHLPTM